MIKMKAPNRDRYMSMEHQKGLRWKHQISPYSLHESIKFLVLVQENRTHRPLLLHWLQPPRSSAECSCQSATHLSATPLLTTPSPPSPIFVQENRNHCSFSYTERHRHRLSPAHLSATLPLTTPSPPSHIDVQHNRPPPLFYRTPLLNPFNKLVNRESTHLAHEWPVYKTFFCNNETTMEFSWSLYMTVLRVLVLGLAIGLCLLGFKVVLCVFQFL